jgi:hypothetical protein
LSPQPEAKKIAKQFVAENKWKVGEIIGFRLASGKWILMRVIGHHIDKGGRNAIVEILDWVRDFIPESIDVRKLTVKPMLSPYYRYPQVFFGEPRIKKQLDRIKPTEVISRPSQKPGGFVVFVWPYMDKLFLEIYGLA